jgi:hypothetical protein
MKITPDVFAHLTHYLKGLANGKVMVLLEVRTVVFVVRVVLFCIVRVVIALRH